MNNLYEEENEYSRKEFSNTSFYIPRLVLDRSLYKKGEKIPVVLQVNQNILKDNKNIASHNSVMNSINGPSSSDYMNKQIEYQVPIDEWVPKPEDKIFNHIRGAIIAPVHKIFNMPDDSSANNMIDYFYVQAKRCYNSDTKVKFNSNGEETVSIGFRDHCTNYMNYFEKYYDKDLQLLGLYANIKFMIDCNTDAYTLEAFLYDLKKYFIDPSASQTAATLNYLLDKMNIEQYNLQLNYKNNKSPVLEYNDDHAKILLKISVMQNMMIPLLTHFITKKKIDPTDIKMILLRAFDMLFQISKRMYNVDLYSKIYETTFSNVIKNTNNNTVLWDMQLIRARNSTSHSIESVESIIMQIIPKYTYNKNIIHFNYNAINRDIKFKVTDIAYEYQFVVLSSSKRDEDNNSECDKYEAHATKMNEAIMIQTKVNCLTTMKRIETKYGPFDKNEINFYYRQLSRNGKFVANSLQKNLVTYLFAKEFDDPQSAKIVNVRQYIILIIAAKRLLESYHMCQLPYMIGGRVNRIVTRKNINKKELQKIESSKYFPMIHKKYNNPKIEQEVILSLIAQILSSEFQTVDCYNPRNNGLTIDAIPDIVAEEVCRFIMLI